MASFIEDDKFLQEIEDKFEDLTKRVHKFAKERTPVDTGYMKSRWRILNSADGWRVVNDAEYAEYVELGRTGDRSGAHILDSIENKFGNRKI